MTEARAVYGTVETELVPDPLPGADHTPVWTVVVPVYNEVRAVGDLMRRIVAGPIGYNVRTVRQGKNPLAGRAAGVATLWMWRHWRPIEKVIE